MADGMTYEIKLRIRVDDKDVDRAQRKVNNLNRGVGGRGGLGGGSTSLSNIPISQQRRFRAMDAYLGRNPSLNNQGFLSNVNHAYGRVGFMQRQFLGNMTSISGWARNISNVGSALGSVGKIAGGIMPALGAVASGIKAIGTAALIFKGMQVGARLGSLYLGNKLMQSQGMGEAASNLMQFSMARKGLGSSYEQALQTSTAMAGEFGFSRTGILNSINMLTGLNTGPKTLSMQEATRIAMQAGKIAHVGGVPFERVNINLQQLLGQPISSARDIRELIQAAPIIGKLAQQSMASKGQSGDVLAYLKDKESLLQVLNDFDKMIESNPFMKARGSIALSKENFFMKVVADNEQVWDKIAKGMDIFYSEAGKIANKILPELGNMLTADKIRESLSDIQTFFGAIYDLGKGLSSLGSFLGGIVPMLNFPSLTVGKYGSRHHLTQGGDITFGGAEKFYTVGSYYGNKSRNKEIWSMFTDAQAQKLPATRSFEDTFRFAYQGLAQGKSSIPWLSSGINTSTPNTALAPYSDAFKAFGMAFKQNPSQFMQYIQSGYTGTMGLNPKAVENFISNYGLSGVNPLAQGVSGQDILSDVTKGQKSLIINFNREIVSMPINIETMNNGDDLVAQLDSLLPDMIVRGMNIALNNATGAM